MIDANIAAATRLYEEPAISPLEESVLQSIEAAQAAKERLEAAKESLKTNLETVIRALLKPGTIIKRHKRGNPAWLTHVQVLRGNDHGTNTFRIASEPEVEPNINIPDISTWVCEAIPISEKTGKDMAGAVHGHNSLIQTVRLEGYMANEGLNDPEENRALLKVVAAASVSISEDSDTEARREVTSDR